MIETIFVLIILGIVAGFAMPVMESGVARSKADRAVTTITNDLRNAYSLAARQRKPIRIVFNNAARTITIRDRASGTVYLTRDLSNQRSPFGLTAMTTSRPAVDIMPSGIASDTLVIRFGVGTNGRVVRMSRVGQIRVK